jgi:hypothetical protein
MPRRKRPESIRYYVRLSRAQAERLAALRQQLHARSDNEVFDYLVTVGTNQRDDLEQLVYSLFGNLADSLAHRFQSLETVSQLHLALTDTYIKYALTALPACRGAHSCDENLRTGQSHGCEGIPTSPPVGRLQPFPAWD